MMEGGLRWLKAADFTRIRPYARLRPVWILANIVPVLTTRHHNIPASCNSNAVESIKRENMQVTMLNQLSLNTILLILMCAFVPDVHASGMSSRCTYTTYQWNVPYKKAVNHRKVEKPRSELTAAEVDPETGCSVCEEDQVTLTFKTLPPVKVCRVVAERVRSVFESLQLLGAPLTEVVGYRVGMTRGEMDGNGNRTGFSNHSFGLALDINASQNGLYENCEEVSPNCRLIKGGRWDPTQKYSLTGDSLVVREFKRNGFRWGGEILGRQKDFMHFSPTGY